MAYSASPVVTYKEQLGASGGTTSAFDTTGSDILFLCVGYLGISSGPPTISDSKGNTWVPLTKYELQFAGSRIYYCIAPTVGSGHTVTATGSSTYASVYVAGFSGAEQASPFDAENGATDASAASIATGSVSPSEDGELVIAFLASQLGAADNPTIDGGFASPPDGLNQTAQGLGIQFSFLVQTSAASANPTWTCAPGAYLTTSIATFKPAGGGAAEPTIEGISSAEAFGAATTQPAAAGTGIGSDEAMGAPAGQPVAAPAGIASAEALGACALTLDVGLTGIASLEVIGTATAPATASLTGIASAEAFGSATLTLDVGLSGISSEEAFGTSAIGIPLAGVASAEAIGSPTLELSVALTGIASTEAIGTVTIPEGAAPSPCPNVSFTLSPEPGFTMAAEPNFTEGCVS